MINKQNKVSTMLLSLGVLHGAGSSTDRPEQVKQSIQSGLVEDRIDRSSVVPSTCDLVFGNEELLNKFIVSLPSKDILAFAGKNKADP